MLPHDDPQIPKISKNKKHTSLALIMKVSSAVFMQIGLKMETGDCPPLNINAMRAISVNLKHMVNGSDCALVLYHLNSIYMIYTTMFMPKTILNIAS